MDQRSPTPLCLLPSRLREGPGEGGGKNGRPLRRRLQLRGGQLAGAVLAGEVISSISRSSDHSTTLCLISGGNMWTEPARRVSSPCPSYQNVTQPLTT